MKHEQRKIKLRNIGHLFTMPDQQMVIPDYQRDFVWKKEEGEEFFEDVNSSSKDDPLLLGTFIFRKGSGEIEIVDGQQRITTILTFLIACRNYMRDELGDKKYILQGYITLPNKHAPAEYGPCRLKTKGKCEKPLEVMSNRDWDGEYTQDMGTKHDWNRMRRVYEFFRKKLHELDLDLDKKQLNELLEKLWSTQYIEITVRNDKEAISTFERVNARGQHLDVHELMKAFLFDKDDPENPKQLKKIKKDWKSIEDNAELSDSSLKRILNSFHFSQKGYTSPSLLYRGLRNIAKPEPENFVGELKTFSEFYSTFSPKGEFLYEKLRHFLLDEIGLKNTKMDDEDRIKKVPKSILPLGLFSVVSVYPLIYSSLLSLKRDVKVSSGRGKKEVDKWISLLKFFEDFNFVTTRITHATSQRGGKLERLYGGYCKEFFKGDGKFIELVESLKKEFREVVPVSEHMFFENFRELSYKKRSDKKLMIYIFHRMDTDGVEPGNESGFFDIEKRYKFAANNIEHILPQNPKPQTDSVHSIGNLLVLHRNDNSSLGDKSPKEKVRVLKKWLRDGKIQNKPHVEKFISFYEKECGGQWDEEHIKKRARHIAKKMYEITRY